MIKPMDILIMEKLQFSSDDIYNPPAVGGGKIEIRDSGRTALLLHRHYDVVILPPRRFLQG